MSLQSEIEKRGIQWQYRKLLKVCVRSQTKENRKLIRKAFNLANIAHNEMRRRTGEPYIIHPIEVAKIVAGEIGLGTRSVVCALLHDVVEDTDYSLEDIKGMFGDKIASITDGLTKISGIFDQKSSLQAENFRKMLLTLSDDVRVILIKLADRLHNMRTLSALPRNKQIKIAGETLFLYAPLAHRLGLYAIKTELEDLSFKYEHPALYDDISQKLKDSKRKRDRYINKFSLPIINKLTELNFNYEISGRTKSVYSIWNKMQNKDVPFEEVYDIFAIRIVFEPNPEISENIQCWNIYTLITGIYQPNPYRLRDWVSIPRANGYEALHTTVMGPEGRWIEVQIRTNRMDEIAERGYAAHWKYKGDKSDEGELDRWIKKIREMLESPESNALEFLDEFKMNLFSSEIFVFTPKGQLKRLPKFATALDLAYEIHTEIGNKAIGAKVNRKLVSLDHVLNSGDQVEILTSDKQQPQHEWLEYAITAKAKSSIKNSLKEERKSSIEKGKIILDYKFQEMNIIPNSSTFRKLLSGYKVSSKDELYCNMGRDIIKLDNIKKIITKKSRNKLIRYWQLRFTRTTTQMSKKIWKKDYSIRPKYQAVDKNKPFILDENIDEINYTIAKCCNPIPGDDVMGYINPNEAIVIHKTKCPNAIKLMSSFGDNIVTAEWTTHKILSFLATIKLQGIDRLGIVNNVTNIISKELNVNMRAISFDSHNGIFEGTIDLYIHNTQDLNNLMLNLKKIKGIDSVVRVENIVE